MLEQTRFEYHGYEGKVDPIALTTAILIDLKVQSKNLKKSFSIETRKIFTLNFYSSLLTMLFFFPEVGGGGLGVTEQSLFK